MKSITLAAIAAAAFAIGLVSNMAIVAAAHAQTVVASNSTFPLDRTYHYYSSPVITFRASNITVIHPGQNETIAAKCGDNNSLPYAGGWKIVKLGGLLTVLESYPDVNAHSWNITAIDIGSSPVSVRAIVTCIHENPVKPTEPTGNATTTTPTALR